jgi:ribonuclease HI
MLNSYKHIIFSDGSSLGNPGKGGYGAVLLQHHKVVTEIGGREEGATNNRMEITALLSALRIIKDEEGPVLCCTDSQYVINSVTKWIHGWKKNGWITTGKTPVINKDLFEEIDSIICEHKKIGHIDFKYVRGHVGVAGNERCDVIATTFARNEEMDLFSGSLSDYAIDILNIGVDKEQDEKRLATKKKSGPAYSYLSLADGVAKRHTTWAECEARVKGKSAVKYKKSMSAEDELSILKSWGAKI